MKTIKRHYEIIQEPRGDVYRGLVSALSPLCSFVLFTLRYRQEASPLAKAVLAYLSADIAVVRVSTSWPGTGSSDSFSDLEYDEKCAAVVYVFHLTERTLSVLLTLAQGLYEWEFPNLPENLCLLRPDRQACLWSAIPDRFAYLYLTDTEMQHVLKQVPNLQVDPVPEEEEWEEAFWWAPEERNSI